MLNKEKIKHRWTYKSTGMTPIEFTIAEAERAYKLGKSKQFSSLSVLRQLFAELPPDHTFTAKELHEAIESFHPLMTKKQEQQLVDNLWEIVNEKLEPKLSSCCQALITDEFENEGVCLKCGEHCGVYKELKE